jgi:hypothetical protein
MTRLSLAKKTIIMISFVPMACRVLGKISVDDRANIFEDGKAYWNQNSSTAAIPSK